MQESSRQDHPGFAGRLIQAVERERRLLAQELHDDLNTQFVVLVMEMSMLERKLPKAEADQMRSIRGRLGGIIETTRSIAHRLHPSIVEHLGLTAALQDLCSALSVPPVEVKLLIQDLRSEIPSDLGISLYRIAQEALRNALKHSGSADIQVRLSQVRHHVILTVQDRGKGFNIKDSDKNKGLGLALIAERVRVLRGECSIRSVPAEGTVIRVSVPL